MYGNIITHEGEGVGIYPFFAHYTDSPFVPDSNPLILRLNKKLAVGTMRPLI